MLFVYFDAVYAGGEGLKPDAWLDLSRYVSLAFCNLKDGRTRTAVI